MILSDLFNFSYGSKLDFNKMTEINDVNGINFVTRSSKNLGISTKVKQIPNLNPYPAGSITVSLGGTYLLSSFIQPAPFYTAQNIMVLTPKKEMSLTEKIYYCLCITKNRFRYSAFGREANRTLKSLQVPNAIPKWVSDYNISKFQNPTKPVKNKKINLNDRLWGWFPYSEVFTIERGHYNKRPEKVGDINFISASGDNNGVTDKISEDVIEKMYDGNCVTVVNNGQHTAYAFYQQNAFTCSHDVNILRIKNKTMNPFIAMFLIPLIRLEKSRFNYGRKWRFKRMQKTLIKLPIDKTNEPDWQFMEDYIKSLPYSSHL